MSFHIDAATCRDEQDPPTCSSVQIRGGKVLCSRIQLLFDKKRTHRLATMSRREERTGRRSDLRLSYRPYKACFPTPTAAYLCLEYDGAP